MSQYRSDYLRWMIKNIARLRSVLYSLNVQSDDRADLNRLMINSDVHSVASFQIRGGGSGWRRERSSSDAIQDGHPFLNE